MGEIRKRFTDREIELLKEHWPTGNKNALAQVAERHSWVSIKAKSNRIGLTRVRRGYPVNESFFSKWSPVMAYILGYTYADGNIHGLRGKKSTWWYWRIDSSDKQIIIDISDAVEWGGKVYIGKSPGHYGKKPMYRLAIGSNKLVADLRNLGLTQNKTKVMQPPDIPSQFLSHFMRGYFDGDGRMGWHISGSLRYISTGIGSASRDFIVWIANAVSDTLNIKTPHISRQHDKDFWSINLIGYNGKQWLDFIYQDATIFLERKHKIYQIATNKGTHPDNKPKFSMSFSKRWSSH